MEVFLPPHETLMNNLMAEVVGERSPWSITDMGLPDVWERCAFGKHARIGIVDSGICVRHPDLEGAIYGADGGRTWKDPEDYNGHGSHVAGIIGARHNQTGVVGVAPAAKIFSAKGLGRNGSGSDRDIAWAIDACIAAEVHVINMSLGALSPSPIIKAAIERALKANILPVVAGGNEKQQGNPPSYPAFWGNNLSISAMNRQRKIANFSTTNDQIDFLAPGVEILSCDKNARYGVKSGSSMAAPWISGLCGLLISYEIENFGSRRTIAFETWYERLAGACDDLGRVGVDPETGNGLPVPGRLLAPRPEPNPDSVPPEKQEGSSDFWLKLLAGVLAGLLKGALK